MGIAGRLKIAREHLECTQKEIASKVSVSVQMWQAYEAGRSIPGGNVLEGMARLGFNVNWILTGEGDIKPADAVTCEWWSERIKLIRGDMSVSELAHKMGFPDPGKWAQKFQAIEDGKIEPNWSLMVYLSQELGISPEWMIDGLGPMYKKDLITDYNLPSGKILNGIDNVKQLEKEWANSAKIYHAMDESLKKYHVDLIRDKLSNLSITLSCIFGERFREKQELFLPIISDSLVRLCIPDEDYASMDEVNSYISHARQSLNENDTEYARKYYLKSAMILHQLLRLESGKWSKEMESAHKEHNDFVDNDSGYKNGLAKLLPIIQNKPGILQTDIYKACPDIDRELISYVLYFAASKGVIERARKGDTYMYRVEK